jgi:hypothetical protein
MLSFSQVKSAGSAGNYYYTEKDNLRHRQHGGTLAGQRGGNAGAGGKVDKQVFTALLQGKLLMAAT